MATRRTDGSTGSQTSKHLNILQDPQEIQHGKATAILASTPCSLPKIIDPSVSGRNEAQKLIISHRWKAFWFIYLLKTLTKV